MTLSTTQKEGSQIIIYLHFILHWEIEKLKKNKKSHRLFIHIGFWIKALISREESKNDTSIT